MEKIEIDEFDRLVSSSEKYIVMFYADWCPFCQKFKPIFEGESTKSKYKMFGAKVNEDDNPLWDRFAISSVPTIIAFYRGQIVSRRDAKMGIGLNKSDLDSLLRDLN
jgi:thioredoxin 1